MIHKLLKTTATATATALLIASILSGAPAFASGSDAGGGAETGDAQSYNAGKGIYAQKLACKTCPLAGKSLDAAMARGLLSGTDTYSLGADEQQALAVYLKLRFKL